MGNLIDLNRTMKCDFCGQTYHAHQISSVTYELANWWIKQYPDTFQKGSSFFEFLIDNSIICDICIKTPQMLKEFKFKYELGIL